VPRLRPRHSNGMWVDIVDRTADLYMSAGVRFTSGLSAFRCSSSARLAAHPCVSQAHIYLQAQMRVHIAVDIDPSTQHSRLTGTAAASWQL
jgi:hypothetical protein